MYLFDVATIPPTKDLRRFTKHLDNIILANRAVVAAAFPSIKEFVILKLFFT